MRLYKTVLVLMAFMIFLVGVMVAISAAQVRRDANNRAFVQALCDYSHTRINGTLEERCGQAQDKTHTEYLCVTRSFDLNCWVETK